MEVDEVTIPSTDIRGGQTFGPVTVEHLCEGLVDSGDELPVMLTPRLQWRLGVRWYTERYRTRGVFRLNGNRILLRPTTVLQAERADWWRRLGYWLFARRTRRQGFFHRQRSRATL